MPLDKKTAEQFAEWGAEPPKVTDHGTPEEIRSKMTQLRPTKWRMSGNQLLGETELGTVCQMLPTDIICVGTDSEGLPILKKIGEL